MTKCRSNYELPDIFSQEKTVLTSLNLCPLALTAITASRLFIDGLWVIEAHAETDTRKLDVVYSIETTESEWQMDGEATIQNKRLGGNRIKYQMRWSIPDGYKPLVTDGDVCWEWSEKKIVAQWEWDLDLAETRTEPIDWAIRLYPVGDIDMDGKVNGGDRGVLFADWGTDAQRSDLDRDGKVGGSDLGILNTQWGWEAPWNQQP